MHALGASSSLPRLCWARPLSQSQGTARRVDRVRSRRMHSSVQSGRALGADWPGERRMHSWVQSGRASSGEVGSRAVHRRILLKVLPRLAQHGLAEVHRHHAAEAPAGEEAPGEEATPAGHVDNRLACATRQPRAWHGHHSGPAGHALAASEQDQDNQWSYTAQSGERRRGRGANPGAPRQPHIDRQLHHTARIHAAPSR